MTELVVAAAEEIGARDGLPGITMRRLGAAIGYAPNSIYHAVGDMDEVILRLNERTLRRLHGSLKRRIKPKLPPVDGALALADGYVAFVRRNPRLWSILVEYIRRQPGPLPDWYRTALSRPLGLVEEVLAPLFPDPDDRNRSVATLWAALNGIASLAVSGKLGVVTAEEAPDLARLLVRRYLAGRKA
ncbi:TetR/AcrR family transcriptional regulator [Bauldia sp.]|uniref:TetR/AcrR family transcriptional regulator n=1 Tax=Bauldia sp. TaxID=2575872 RepID=UPI003BAA63C0